MGYSDATYQIGKMLHQEYEAKYSVPVELVDSAEDNKRKPLKITGFALAIVAAGILTALSLLI